jgi:hypothetical protein
VPWGVTHGPFNLSAQQLPAGVSVSFNPASISAGETSQVTVTTDGTTPVGLDGFTFEASPQSSSDEYGFTGMGLVVTATPQPTGFVSVSPAYAVLSQGGNAVTVKVTVNGQNGFTGSAFLYTDPPSGITASFSQNPTSSSSVLTLTASASAQPGLWNIGLCFNTTANSCGIGGYVDSFFVLVQPVPAFSLTSSASSMIVPPSSSASTTISVTPQTGFSGNVTLSALNLPSGMTATFGTNPSTGGTSVLTLTAGNNTPTGNYLVIVTGTSGVNTVTIPIALVVMETVSTTTALTINPSGGTLTAGASYSLTATVLPASGSVMPTGNVVFTIGSATQTEALNSSGVATYTGTAPSTAGALAISAAYQGTAEFSASISNTLSEIVVISSFTVSGTTVSVAPGATTGNTSVITVTPVNGFTGTVNLSCAISPTAASDPATCGISPASVTISGGAQTSTLTVYTTAPTSCSAMVHPTHPGEPWYAAGSATLACLLLFGIPARRRSWRTMLGMLAILVVLSGGILACGGGGGGAGGGGGNNCTPNSGTTAGSYTITLTGTSGTLTATNTITLTVQ